MNSILGSVVPLAMFPFQSAWVLGKRYKWFNSGHFLSYFISICLTEAVMGGRVGCMVIIGHRSSKHSKNIIHWPLTHYFFLLLRPARDYEFEFFYQGHPRLTPETIEFPLSKTKPNPHSNPEFEPNQISASLNQKKYFSDWCKKIFRTAVGSLEFWQKYFHGS